MNFHVLSAGGSALTAQSEEDSITLKKYCDSNNIFYQKYEYVKSLITFPDGDVKATRCTHKFWEKKSEEESLMFGVLTELTDPKEYSYMKEDHACEVDSEYPPQQCIHCGAEVIGKTAGGEPAFMPVFIRR